MSLLIHDNVKKLTHLLQVDLQYNNISQLVQNSIKKLLSETSFALNQFESLRESPNKDILSGYDEEDREVNLELGGDQIAK